MRFLREFRVHQLAVELSDSDVNTNLFRNFTESFHFEPRSFTAESPFSTLVKP